MSFPFVNRQSAERLTFSKRFGGMCAAEDISKYNQNKLGGTNELSKHVVHVKKSYFYSLESL